MDVLVKLAEEISKEEGGSTNCDASKGCESTDDTCKETEASNERDAAKGDDTPVKKEGRRANVVQVVHGEDGEVEGIYFQTESQKKLYPVIGTVVLMDGTHGTNNSGFTLYHLLSEDNNGESQPVAQYFTKFENKESISEFLRIFSEVKKLMKSY